MNRSIWISLFFAFFGCTRHTNTAALPSECMIASSNPRILSIAIKHKLTAEDRDRLYHFYPKTLEKIENLKHLDIQDIKNLTRAGVADKIIIHEINATRSTFFLTHENEQDLKQAGVSKKVIFMMKETVYDRY